MRKLVAVLLTFGLLLGVAGATLADCGGEHTGTPSPAPEQRKPQA